MAIIPAYCVWRAMRAHTTKAISREAVKEMQAHIDTIIKDSTRKAEALQSELNDKLNTRLKRQRINGDVVREAVNGKQ
jgi:ribosome maturation protein Sdo1